MDAHQLLKAGRLNDAISALEQHIAATPGDSKARTFLFELICFTGDFEHARLLLEQLRKDNRPESIAGIEFYQWVLRGEQLRQATFLDQSKPPVIGAGGGTYAGTLNGRDFLAFSDVDPRIGEDLEILWTGRYFRVPLSAVRRLQVPPPKRLRDLLWLPAELVYLPTELAVSGSAEEQAPQCLDIVLPMMSPLTWQHLDDEVRIGRHIDWRENQFGQFVPYGLKCFRVDDRHLPIAEIRDLQIKPLPTAH